jgi:hypothetical protein
MVGVRVAPGAVGSDFILSRSVNRNHAGRPRGMPATTRPPMKSADRDTTAPKDAPEARDPGIQARKDFIAAHGMDGADQALADADQTAANADQKISGADQRGSDSDQASAALDQAASDRDQAVADRQHAAAVDPTPADERAYQEARSEREAVATDRQQNRIDRARTARDRDAAASQRDRTADERDERGLARDKESDEAK